MLTDFLKLNSLRSRLMLLVALAIAPSVLMTMYTGWKERQDAIRVSQENLQRLTNLAAVNVAESLSGVRQLLSGLSNVPELMGSAEECSTLLAATLKRYPNYANLGLIQLNGDVTCSAVPSARPVNLADRDHFQRAIKERRFIAGNYVFGRVIQQHTINLTYPVLDRDGVPRAVVFAALTLPELDRFIQGINLPAGSVLITTDAQGSIISRRPDPDLWFGKKVSPALQQAMARRERVPMEILGPDEVLRLHAFARVGGPDLSDFTLTIGIPSGEIVASAWRDQAMLLGVLIAIMVLALIATWFVGNIMIVSRVRRLVSTAQAIASGKLDARSGIQYGREEISTLARALDDMALALQRKEAERDRAEEELRAADRRKDEFLAMLAHELRNPLAPIRTAADVLRLTHSNEPRVRNTTEIISRQIEHMTGLVDDLLDVSRVTRGLVKLNREVLDLREVLGAAIEQSRSMIEEHGHRLTVQMPPQPAWCSGDRMRLTQIVTNLLNNAAKYTPQGGAIQLAMHEIAHQYAYEDANGSSGAGTGGTGWCISVQDNGQGISAELLPRVFELFSQAERTPDRSQGGLGVGLALVKSLIELHGGSVSVRSAGVGKGSTFTLRLPSVSVQAAPSTLPDAGHAAAPPITADPLRLLVVDDNTDAADTTAALLRSGGHRVSVAYDAHQALALAERDAPQVLVLDIGLPEMDGYELARRLRLLPQTAHAMLIALTGYGQADDRERSRRAGFDHHLVKPADPAVLNALLAEAARMQQGPGSGSPSGPVRGAA